MQSIWKKAAGETTGEQNDEIPISESFLYPATLQDRGRSKRNTPPPWQFLNITLFLCCSLQTAWEEAVGGGLFASSPSCINKRWIIFSWTTWSTKRARSTCWPPKYIISHIFLLDLLLQVLAMRNAKQRAALTKERSRMSHCVSSAADVGRGNPAEHFPRGFKQAGSHFQMCSAERAD